MGETITLDVFGGNGAFLQRARLGGDSPSSLSIGSASNVVLRGIGVLPTHGHVALIGATFYAASTSAIEPLFVDGEVVPLGWNALDLPCSLTVGDAFIHVRSGPKHGKEDEGAPTTERRPTVLPKLGATLADPFAIIALAPNVASPRTQPILPAMPISAPLPPLPPSDSIDAMRVPVRRSRIAYLFVGVVLAIVGISAYEARAMWSPKPALVLAATEPPPPSRRDSPSRPEAANPAPSPSPPADSAVAPGRPSRQPRAGEKRPIRKHRP